MTGKGGIAHAPYRRLKWMLAVHLVWLTIVLVLGGWWGSLILSKGARIAELESRLGLATHESWQRTQRMMFWEAGTFVLLLVASTFLLVYLYWREAKRARALQAFFASVTHELRTPLTSIRLQAESIADSVGKNPLVGRLLEDTQRLESQVERTLELARVEGGGRVFKQPIRLRPWLERMTKSWVESYGERIRFAAEVPDVLVQADVSALQVILKNLVENSLRHGGQERLELRLSAQAARGKVELRVRDNGPGFRGERRRLGKLFEKGEHSQGAGVGLYLVSVLMERMGGRAEFAGEGGFEARLTFERAARMADRILVLEDEKNVGSTLTERLKQEGFEVTWAKTLEEARLEISQRKFDLALLDVGLPDGSGFQAAEELRRQQRQAALIFLTAFGNPEDRVRGLELGAEDYVVKPFHLKELLLRIQNGLKRARYLSAPPSRTACGSGAP